MAVAPGDADTAAAGHQVALAAGESTVVAVTVTAEDGATRRVYSVEVARSEGVALESATVDGAELVLGYVEALDGGSVPDVGDFAVVVVDSVTDAVSAPVVEGVSVEGSEVVLALAAAVRSGDRVEVSYRPGSVPIQGAAGWAAAIEGHGAANETAAAADAALAALAVSGVAELGVAELVLAPAFDAAVLGYRAAAELRVGSVTVAGRAVDPRASVAVEPADSDTAAEGHQVALAAGESTVVAVTVTAEDGATRRVYSVEVARSEGVALESATVDGAELVLGYVEALDAGSVPDVGDFAVVVVDSVTDAVSAPVVEGVSVEGSEVVLALAAAVRSGDRVEVSYRPGSVPIQGAAGVDWAAAIEGHGAANETAAAADASLAALAVSGVAELGVAELGVAELVLAPAFDAAVLGYAAAAGLRVGSVTVAGRAVDPRASVAVEPADSDTAAEGHQVALAAGESTVVAVTVTAEDGATRRVYSVEVARSEGVALESATVDGAELVLGYVEALDAGSVPDVGDFAVVVVDSVTDAVSAPVVEGVSVEGSEAVLALAAAVRSGDRVEVSYRPGSVPIQGAAGVDWAAAIEGHGAANETAAAADASLAALAVSGVAELGVAELGVAELVLAPAFDAAVLGYRAAAELRVGSVTVAGRAVDPRASVAVEPADSDTAAEGHQVALAAGESTVVAVTVTAEDGATRRVYSVEVARSEGVALESATVDGAELVLGYVEALDAGSVPDVGDFAVVVVDSVTDAVSAPVVEGVSVEGSEVVLALAAAVRSGDRVEVSYRPGSVPIQGAAGVDWAAAIEGHGAANETAAAADAALAALAVSGVAELGVAELVLAPAFDAAVLGYAAAAGLRVGSVTVAGRAVDPRASVAVEPADSDTAAEGHQVALAAGESTVVAVTVTAEDGATRRVYSVEVARSEGVALESATVDGAELVLGYVEALDAGSVPDVGDFAVVVDSVTDAVSAPVVEGVSVEGSEVVLALAAAVRSGDRVEVSYRPGSVPIQGAAGVDWAAAIEGHGAANETAAAADAALAALAVSGVAELGVAELVLAPAFDAAVLGYAAAAGLRVGSVTVAGRAVDPRASVAVEPADSDTAAEGHQVALAAGESTVVAVTVTAEDGATRRVYSVEVARSEGVALESATVDGAELVLGYVEALDAGSVPDVGDFAVVVVDSDNNAMSSPSVEGVSVEGSEAVLALAAAVRSGDRVEVSYRPGSVPIQGAAGWAAAIEGHGAANETAAAADAALAALAVSGVAELGVAELVLAPAFDAAVLGYRAAAELRVGSVTVAGRAVDPRASVAVEPADSDTAAEGHQVALAAGESTVVAVTVTAEDGATRRVYSVEVARSEGVALESATVDGAELVLGYVEALDAGSVPDVGDFAVVVVDSVTDAVSAPVVEGVSVEGSEVVLALAAAVRSGDRVEVSYRPGSVPIQGAAGVDWAAAIEGHGAANETAAAADASLASLAVDALESASLEVALTSDAETLGYAAEAGLRVSSVAIEPQFDPTVRKYAASVPYEVASVMVTVMPVDPRARATDVTVTVTAEDGTTQEVYTVAVARAAALGLVSATVDGDTLALAYAEALDAASVPDNDAFAVVVTDSITSTVTAAEVVGVSVDGSSVLLALSTPVRHNDAVTVGYAPGGAPVQAAAGGNDAAGFEGRAAVNVTAAAGDAALAALGLSAPGGAAAVLAPAFDAATVSYSSSVLYEVAAVTVAAAAEDSRASAAVVPADSDDAAAGHQVALAADRATDVTVTVTAEDGTTQEVYTVAVARAAALGLVSATVDGDTLALAYAEALDAASVPDNDAFAVVVTDSITSTVTAAEVVGVSVDGSSVLLALSTPVRHNDAVTVGYAPGGAPVQAAAGGNDAAGFEGRAAVNVTAAAGDAALAALGLSAPGGAAAVLAPAFDAATVSYSSSVLYEVAAVTVAAAAEDSRASAAVVPADSDDAAAGHQVALAADRATDVTVTVTAEDGTTQEVYTVAVARAAALGLVSATVDGDTLALAYAEALDAASVPDVGDFAVVVVDSDNNAMSSPSVEGVSVAGSSVLLALSEPVRHNDAVTVGYTPGGAPVQAAAGGNDAAGFEGRAAVNVTAAAGDAALAALGLSAPGGAAAVLAPAFDAATVSYSSSVLYEVAAVTVAAAAEDSRASAAVVPADSDDAAAGHQVALAADRATDVTVTVTAEDGTTQEVYTVAVARAAALGLVSATVDGDTLALAYAEALDAASVPDVGDFAVVVVDSDNNAMSSPSVEGVSVAGSSVLLALSEPVRHNDAVTVGYTPGGAPVQAAAGGNDAAGFEGRAAVNVTAAAGDAALAALGLSAPGGAAAVLAPAFDAATVSYSSSVLYEVAAVTVAAAAEDSRASAAVVPADSDDAAAGHQVALAADRATDVTVTVTAEDGTTQEVYTVAVARAAALGLVSATVDGDTLALAYAEALDAASVPDVGDFAVVVVDSDNNAMSSPSVEGVSVAGSSVLLALSEPVRHNDAVTVGYTPGGAPVQAAAGGNDAAGFEGRAAVNVTAAAGDAALAALGLSAPGGAAAVLAPAFDAATVSYSSSVLYEVAAVTVAAAAEDSRASAAVVPADSDDAAAGHQVALAADRATDVTVTVTAEDGTTQEVYTVAVARAAALGLVSATVDGDTLVLAYAEALDAASVPDVGDFAVVVVDSDNNAMSSPSVEGVSVAGSSVLLALSEPVRHNDAVTVGYTPGGAPVQAAAGGNDAAGFEGRAAVNVTAAAGDAALAALGLSAPGGAAAVLAPAFDAATVSYSSSVLYEVAAVTVAAAAEDSRASAAVVPADSDDAAAGHQVALAADRATDVTVTVTAEDGTTQEVYTVAVARAAALGLVSATVDGDTLVLAYAEALDAASVPDVGDFAVVVVDSDNNAMSSPSVEGVSVAGSSVLLALSEPVRHNDAVTVGYTPGGAPVQAAAGGNDAAGFEGRAAVNVTAAAGDAALAALGLSAPGGAAAVLAPAFDAATVSYSSSVLYEVAAVTVAAAAEDSRASAAVVPADSDDAAAGHQVALAADRATDVTVTVTAEDGTTQEVYTVAVARAAALGLVSATVDGDTLVLAYAEALDAASVPDVGDFAVVVVDSDNNAMSSPSVEGVSVAGSSVLLALSEPVRHNDAVTVGYTPGGAPVQAAAGGNDAAGFEGRAAVNVTAAAGDAALAALGLSAPGGAAAVLAPAFDAATVSYSSSVLYEVAAVTVAAAAEDSRASAAVVPADSDDAAAGHQVALAADRATDVTVTVTAEDGTTQEVYTVAVARAAALGLVSATVDGDTLVLAYAEALDAASVPDVGDFAVVVVDSDNNAMSSPSVEGVSVAGSSVLLALSEPVRHNDAVTVGYTPGGAPVQAAAGGNDAAGFEGRAAVNVTAAAGDAALAALGLSAPGGAAAVLAPAFDAATVSYSSSVLYEVAAVTVAAAAEDSRASAAVVPADSDDAAAGHQVALAADRATDVTVTVTAEDGTTQEVYTVAVARAAALGLVSATVDGDTLVLAYAEALDAASVPDVGDFAVVVVDSDNNAMSSPSVEGVSVAGSSVLLALSEPVRHNDAVTVGYTPGGAPVQAAAGGNDAAGFEGRAAVNVTAAAGDAALAALGLSAPGGAAAVLAPAFDAATVSYSSSVLYEVAAVTVAAAAEDSRASAAVVPADSDDAAAGHQVALAADRATDVTVTVTAEDGTTQEVYTVAVARAAALGLVSATVDGDTLVLAYAEALDAASVPDVGDFAVVVVDSDNNAMSSPSVEGVSVAGSSVLLALSEPVRHNDAVTVGYTPGGAPVQAAAGGNDAAGFEGRAAVNVTAAAGDAALAALGLSAPGGAAAVLAPAFDAATVSYSSSVLYEVAAVTVAAAAEDSRASAAVVPADSDDAAAGHQVALAADRATDVTVTVTAEDGTTQEVYTVAVARAAALGLVSATVDGDTLVLAYAEALDAASVPDVGDFAVVVVDSITSTVTAAEVVGVSVDGSSVLLALSTPVRHNDAVTVGYAPGGAPVQAAAGGNDAAGFEGRAAVNVTAAAGDAALAALGLSAPGGAAAVLAPAFDAAVLRYRAPAGSLAWVSVAAAAEDSRASVAVVPADSDGGLAGHQVALAPGETTRVTVTVTAEDGTTQEVYTVDVARPGGVAAIDWPGFTRGAPGHHNADEARGWLLTALKYGLNTWWTDYKNFDAQDGSEYLDFIAASNEGGSPERRLRDSTSFALALAVALRTGAYDAGVTGVSRDVALSRALKLVRSLAYRHDVNAPASQRYGRWGYHWQSALWAAHAGFAGWMLWDDLPDADRSRVKSMVVAEASEYRNPVYYRDRSGSIVVRGDSQSEEQAWNSYVVSLAAVMMPEHSDADAWRTSSVHLMLSTFSRPEDVSSVEVYHGYPLREWLNGSNIYSDGTVVNHDILHPDYTAAGTVEFNSALVYFLAGLAPPEAARFNAGRVMAALVELDFETGSAPYLPEISDTVESPGGTIFRPGTLCTGTPSEVEACRAAAEASGETFSSGQSRGCAQGAPTTSANVFYPMGSSWSTLRRPNLANFAAQADVFGLDSRIDDSTRRGDYWFGCYARDARAMQARHSDGNTWNDKDNLDYFGREGQSAHYAAKSWLAYWIQHQNEYLPIEYQNDRHGLEFNRIATIEAEDPANTIAGSSRRRGCARSVCSGNRAVELRGAFTRNALTVVGVDVPSRGTYPLHLVVVGSQERRLRVAVDAVGGDSIDLTAPGRPGTDRAAVATASIDLAAGSNNLIISRLDKRGNAPIIDRIILGPAAETDPPVLVSAAVDGAVLVLAYAEALDAASVPDVGDFAVVVVDSITSTVTAAEVVGVSVDGSSVLLALSTPVRHNDAVTVGYAPGGAPVQAAAGGNDAAGFEGRAAVNVTAAAGDAALAALGLSAPGGAAAVLAPAFDAAVLRYRAPAGSLAWVSVAAAAEDSRASVAVVPADSDGGLAGHQVALAPGETTRVTVTVTAEDGTTQEVYTVDVARPGGVAAIDWPGFTRGAPGHHNADEARGWLLTALKYGLNTWWTDYKNFDAQDGSEYLDFIAASNEGGSPERRLRDSTSFALALAVALRTGAYDAGVTGVSRDVALSRALKLVRSLAYRHDVNAPASQRYGRWGYHWQSALWAAHAGFAGWMLWDDLPDADRSRVKSMVVAEASEYRNPVYYRDRSGSIVVRGDSQSEEQAWNSYVVSLAAVMMPEHSDADAWRTSSVHLMLSTFSRPEDVSSVEVYHGYPLREWLNGSNIYSDGTVVNHDILHPDYTAAGTVEFNSALVYFLAGLAPPEAARFNAGRVMAALVELDFETGSAPYLPEISDTVESPGGTIFRPGTLCTGTPSEVEACRAAAEASGETFSSGQSRGCAQGAPTTSANVFYPMGSSWSTLRRPNLANFAAQADVFGLDSRIDDSTRRGDYWFGCYARDARAMQARHSDGNTWNDKDNLDYFGREGQSAHYAAKSWLAYWIQHQNEYLPIEYQNDRHGLEFNRIATIEAEDPANTIAGSSRRRGCARSVCSGNRAVELRGAFTRNALTVVGVDVPSRGTYPLHLVVVGSQERRLRVAVDAVGGDSIDLTAPGRPGTDRAAVATASIDLAAGSNNLIISRLDKRGNAPIIDRIILGPAAGAGNRRGAARWLRSAAVVGSNLVLVLAYGEDLDEGSVPDNDAFAVSVTDSITSTVTAAEVVGVSVDGREVSLTLSEPVRFGDAVTVGYTPGAGPIADLAKNPAAALGRRPRGVFDAVGAGAVGYPVANDTAAAGDAALAALELSGVSGSGVVLSPAFDSGVAAGYTASVGYETAAVSVTAAAADSRAAVALPDDDDLDTAGVQVALEAGATATIVVTVTAEDGSTATYTVAVDRAGDIDPPVLVSTAVDGAVLVLAYGEDLDEGSVPDNDAFAVSVTDSITSTVTAAEVVGVSVDGREVSLTLSEPVRFGDAVTVGYTPGAGPIADLAKNPAAALVGYPVANDTAAAGDAALKTLGLSEPAGTAVMLDPAFDAATPGYSSSVLYAVAAVTVSAAAQDPRASAVVSSPADSDPVTGGPQAALGVGTTSIVVTVTAEDGSTATYTVAVDRADDISDDTDPPVLVSTAVDGAVLVLAYGEDLDEGSVPDNDAFAVSVTDSITSTVTAAEVVGVSVDGREVSLTLSEPVRFGDAVTVGYTPGAGPIADLAKNPAAALVGYPVANDTAAAGDAALKTLGLSEPAGTAVMLDPAFDAATPGYSSSVLYAVAAVTVSAAAQDPRASAVVSSPADSDPVTGGPQAALGVGTTSIVVTVTAEDGSTATYTVAVDRAGDIDPPVLVSTAVDGAVLVLAYGEDLDEGSVPDNDAFAVSVTDSITSTVTAAEVVGVSVDGREVSLTLSEPVRFGDAVTVGYTPGAGPIADLAKNPAAALVGYPVANDTAAAGDAALKTLGLSEPAGTAVMLDPAFDAATPGYSSSVLYAVAAVTVSAAAQDPRASAVVSSPADSDPVTGGPQAALGVGTTSIVVTVTAEDGSTATYTVAVDRADDISDDTDPPVLVSTAVDGAVLVLAYGEDLDEGSVPDNDAFAVSVTDSITSTVTAAEVVGVSVDGREVSLTLSEPVRFGDAVTVGYTPGAGPIADLAKNPAAALVGYPVANDTAAAGDAALKTLGLSEPAGTAVMLDPAFDAATPGYSSSVLYAVAAVTVSAAAQDPRASAVVSSPADSDPVTGGPQAALGVGTTSIVVTVTAEDGSTATYTVAVDRADDISDDTDPPVLVSTAVDGAVLVLAYGEDLDEGSVPDNDAFAVSVTDSITSTVTAAEVVGVSVDGREVSLTLSEPVRFGDAVTVGYTPGAGPIADLAKNPAAALVGYPVANDTAAAGDAALKTLGLSEPAGTAVMLDPAFDAATPGYSSSVLYAVAAVTVSAAAQDPRASAVVSSPADSDPVTGGPQAALGVGTTSIVVTVTAEDGSTATYTVAVDRADDISDDTDPPVLVSTAVDGAVLVLAYGEDLDEGSVPDNDAFAVSVTDSITSTVTAAEVVGVSVDGREVSLTLSEPVRFGDAVTVGYTPGAGPIADLAKNPAAALVGYPVANDTAAAGDAALKTLGLSEPAGTAVMLDPAFDAATPGYSSSVLYAVAAVTVSAAAQDPRASAVVSSPADSDPVTGGPQAALGVGTTSIVVTVTAEDGSTATYTVAVDRADDISDDTDPPVLVSTAVDGAVLVLAYGEDLDEGSVPDNDAFAVSVTDSITSTVTAAEVVGVSVDGREVSLTLSEPVRFGDAVTVGYTPGAGPIADLAKNPAAALVGYPVANDTAAAGDAALAALELPTHVRRRASRTSGLDSLIFIM